MDDGVIFLLSSKPSLIIHKQDTGISLSVRTAECIPGTHVPDTGCIFLLDIHRTGQCLSCK